MMKTLTYKNKFRPGNTVKSIKTKYFCDGTKERSGQLIKVTEGTVSFYNFFADEYKRVIG